MLAEGFFITDQGKEGVFFSLAGVISFAGVM